MRIVVCVKHVPDADSDRRIEEGRLVRGEDDVLNELDEYAIEAAVSTVEELGGEVIALTMGPEESEDALVRALQMGADRAVLVTDEALAGADALGTARVLAAVVAALAGEEPVDMVITGMASLDGMTSMVAPAMATHLGWPLLDLAHSMQVEGGSPAAVTIERRADGNEDVLRSATPVVVSVTDQINEPRYPSFKELRAARSKPLDVWEVDELAEAGIDLDGITLSSIEVLAADPKLREAGVVVTDSGDAGRLLAEFITDRVEL
ncbi:electron transfer flavoprotein subunit beta/FixA family protein [Actinomyces minihominis]|uniref:electron transfer flavoprotein subunit beta/FixA family protein n=1 Tax=Actinomyces minihominis TaxID=2002838 RepID=UPI000C06AFEF|nr:electron transfer flavoprotein subunit beta/FixA family protein [Actinomyces minihominis]